MYTCGCLGKIQSDSTPSTSFLYPVVESDLIISLLDRQYVDYLFIQQATFISHSLHCWLFPFRFTHYQYSSLMGNKSIIVYVQIKRYLHDDILH